MFSIILVQSFNNDFEFRTDIKSGTYIVVLNIIYQVFSIRLGKTALFKRRRKTIAIRLRVLAG